MGTIRGTQSSPGVYTNKFKVVTLPKYTKAKDTMDHVSEVGKNIFIYVHYGYMPGVYGKKGTDEFYNSLTYEKFNPMMLAHVKTSIVKNSDGVIRFDAMKIPQKATDEFESKSEANNYVVLLLDSKVYNDGKWIIVDEDAAEMFGVNDNSILGGGKEGVEREVDGKIEKIRFANNRDDCFRYIKNVTVDNISYAVLVMTGDYYSYSTYKGPKTISPMVLYFDN